MYVKLREARLNNLVAKTTKPAFQAGFSIGQRGLLVACFAEREQLTGCLKQLSR